MNVDVVIPLYNGGAFIDACLSALKQQTLQPRQIYVVDDQSTDDAPEHVRQHYPNVTVLVQPQNSGFARTVNSGLARTRDADMTLVLNQDTVAAPDSLEILAKAMRTPGCGVLGCKLLFPETQKLQHAGGYVDWATGNAQHHGYGESDSPAWGSTLDVDFVTGAALALSRAALAATGGFDAHLSPAYYEDVDLCYRARAVGLTVRYVSAAQLTHHEGSVLTRDSYRQHWGFFCGRLGFVLKHGTREQIQGVLGNDKYFREHAALTDDNLAHGRACVYQAARIADLRRRRLATYPADTLATDDGFWHDIAATLLNTADVAFAQMSHDTAQNTAVQIPVKQPMLREYAYTSSVPVIGPLIVQLRSVFNSLTGRRARYQTQFNAQVLNALEQLDRRSALLARQQQELLRTHIDLTARITQENHANE